MTKKASMCFLLLFLASSLAAPLLDPAPLDCASIKSPIDPDSKLPILAVRDQTDGSCVVECDMKRGATFADGASMVLEKAGLKKATCFTDSIEHPGEAPGTSDPEMIVTSCPDFLLYIGWDRDKERTMGNMRQELLLKTNAAVKAIAEGFKQ